jgi:ribonuclease P protein component
MLPGWARLKRAQDFTQVRRQGSRWRKPLLILNILPNTLSFSRYGFVVSRHVGGAVVRNRVKRRLRAIIYNHITDLTTGFDVVIVAQPATAQAAFAELDAELMQLFEHANLLRRQVVSEEL